MGTKAAGGDRNVHGRQWMAAYVDGGGLAGIRGLLVAGGVLMAAAVAAGFVARAFGKKKRLQMGGEGSVNKEMKLKIEEGGEQKRRNSPFLDDRSLPSPGFTPSPLASSEDDNERTIDAVAPLLHVPVIMAKVEDHVESQTILMNVDVVADDGGFKERWSEKEHEVHWENAAVTDGIVEQKADRIDEDDDTYGSSEEEEESGEVSDATESDSMDSVAYTRWPAEGTDSSYSSEEEEDVMKSSLDTKIDGKGSPTSRTSGTSEKKMVVGEGNQAASAEGTEMVTTKTSNLPLHLMLALVVLAVLLLLLGRRHRRVVETSHLLPLPKVLHHPNCSS